MGRKSLSQYFLTSSAIARSISESLGEIPNRPVVLEIGGGRGILTEALLKTHDNIVVVEIDSYLAKQLRDRFSNYDDIRIINGDILKIDLKTISPDGDIYLCGNIPYHISGLLIRWISEHHPYISKVVLMLQKEVALRLSGVPGDKEYSALSVILAIDFNSHYLFSVSPHNFTPVPKVDSGVVKLVSRKKSLLDDSDRNHFINMVKTAFSQRRKKLLNTLKNYGGFNAEFITDIILKAGIDPDRRPGTLSVNDYIKLYFLLKEKNKAG